MIERAALTPVSPQTLARGYATVAAAAVTQAVHMLHITALAMAHAVRRRFCAAAVLACRQLPSQAMRLCCVDCGDARRVLCGGLLRSWDCCRGLQSQGDYNLIAMRESASCAAFL